MQNLKHLLEYFKIFVILGVVEAQNMNQVQGLNQNQNQVQGMNQAQVMNQASGMNPAYYMNPQMMPQQQGQNFMDFVIGLVKTIHQSTQAEVERVRQKQAREQMMMNNYLDY